MVTVKAANFATFYPFNSVQTERRDSVSSGDSPPAIPKPSQGVPKHAQERIEERQAKVKVKSCNISYNLQIPGMNHLVTNPQQIIYSSYICILERLFPGARENTFLNA